MKKTRTRKKLTVLDKYEKAFNKALKKTESELTLSPASIRIINYVAKLTIANMNKEITLEDLFGTSNPIYFTQEVINKL